MSEEFKDKEAIDAFREEGVELLLWKGLSA